MKKKLFLAAGALAVVFVLSFFLSCAHKEHKENNKPEEIKLTTVEVPSTLIDIGEVKQGGEAKAIFKLKNAGQNPLIISDAKTECHCTLTEWPKEPVAPMGIATIVVNYDSKTIGFFQQTATLQMNNKEGILVLIIRGKII
jgi:hypothetical protein